MLVGVYKMDNQTGLLEITAGDLKRRLEAGDEVAILDVREPHELEICKLDNRFHVPLGQLPARLNELESHKDRDVVVYCRSGKRSERACQYMRENGFVKVANLKGGILAWANDVDPTMAKY